MIEYNLPPPSKFSTGSIISIMQHETSDKCYTANSTMETIIDDLQNGDIDANDALDRLNEIMREQQRTGALSVSVYLSMPKMYVL